MKCPYCDKEDFVPDVAKRHAESYGGGSCHVYCRFCHKVVQIYLSVIIACTMARKSDRKHADWVEWA